MIRSLASPPGRRLPFHALALLLVVALYYSHLNPAPQLVYFTGHTGGGAAFSYEVTSNDLTVDWPGGGDFAQKTNARRISSQLGSR